ncbi:hypothetical protein ACRALDRAFT_1080493 [Sodiomyces alcalophilus JCM 7366]|uniref:uncharacterized protein n=1 Tax=Sodiomyces alcalophilus JCM 7366 TaxID=591952 RepID=UPI0039B36787
MAKGSFPLAVPSKAVDPTLDALFASSAGPAKPLPKSRYSQPLPSKPQEPAEESGEESEGNETSSEGEDDSEVHDDDDEESSGSEEGEDSEDESSDETNAAVEDRILGPPKKEKVRKRKRDENDNLEGEYLDKLSRAEKAEHQKEKRRRSEANAAEKGDASSSEASSASDEEMESEDDDEAVPMHESLVAKGKDKGANQTDPEIERANRTVFVSNVATSASTTKADRRALLKHLSSILGEAEKIESIRFRSLPFSTLSMPKRAAYITQSVMEATTKSANAYVVYPTPAAARKAVTELNGTVVLDRHIRVDSVAHPSPIDHRRCVFVGNLGFMDDETVLDKTADGELKERKRAKIPADVEEGLWRTFSKHAGKVESVRVVRDPKTRVGKGFAYVQFYETNDVESALLLNEKKFPPLLPRTLRVTRAKALHKTALAQQRAKNKAAAATKPEGEKKSTKYQPKVTPEEMSMAGRAAKLLGKSGALRGKGSSGKDRSGKREKPARANGSGVVPKTPEQVIFEGKRASEKDGRPSDIRLGKKVSKGRVAKARRTARSSAWKKRDSK